MGMSVTGKGPQSEINVTPLVDIVLVLLIIFMVITPLLSKQLPVEVPQKAEIEQPPEEVKEQLFIKLYDDGRIELNKVEVSLDELGPTIARKLEGKTDKVVFFDGEDNVPYGNAVALMDIAKGAGATTIGMITPQEQPDDAAGGEVPAGAPAPE